MNEPGALFDADRLIPVSCPVCGAVREPGQERAPDCKIDRDREAGDFARRPLGCPNTIDPATTPIPY